MHKKNKSIKVKTHHNMMGKLRIQPFCSLCFKYIVHILKYQQNSHQVNIPLFVSPISLIPFHSIFFNFSNPSNYYIPFHFFSTTFFNFPNPYTISLNLNHSYYFKINKVKSFLHHFYKPFSNNSKSFFPSHFHPNKWDGMAKMAKPNKG